MSGRAALLGLLAVAGTAQTVPAPAPAVSYQVDEFQHLPRLLWDDAGSLARAPGGWTSSQWTQVALGVAAVTGAGLLLDRRVDEAVVRNRRASWDRAAKDVAQLGGVGGLVLLGGGYLTTSLLGRDEARSFWVDAGIATVLAQVAVQPVKLAVGRAGPDQDRGAHSFRPFSTLGSFPSGHTAQAFAIASVAAQRSDNPWVGAGAYGLAGLVGLARLETRDHFSSDVLAGAAVGTLIGRAVAPLDLARRQGGGSRVQLSVTPVWAGTFQGIQLVAKF